MSNKAKMYKINSVATFPNSFQNYDYKNPVLTDAQGVERKLKGKWNEEIFENNYPIVLELACGKGDYTIGLARQNAQKNYIGIDVKGARIFTGAKTALEEGLKNVAFARMRIENILNFFAPSEVSEIWITFPDPFPKKGDAKRRLSAAPFLELYKKIIKPGGKIHFKTDDIDLFRFTREVIDEHKLPLHFYAEDIYNQRIDKEEAYIQTFYEKGHLANGRTINYLIFSLE